MIVDNRMQRKTICLIAAAVCLLILESPAALAQRFDPKTLPDFTKGGLYMGKYEMGLYPDGKSEMPAKCLEAGLRMASLVRPRNKAGEIDEANGKIIALNLGHSIATQFFRVMQARLKEHAEEINPKFQLILGSYANHQLTEIKRLRGIPWERARRGINRAKGSFEQVQVLFLHTTLAGPGNPSGNGPPPPPFPETMRRMQRDVAMVLAHCAKIYPNLRICYITCDELRNNSGMEPHVWREAFAFKWLIEAQIKGEKGYEFEDTGDRKRRLPWMCWGPYIWDANWTRDMYMRDGIHPNEATQNMVIDKYWDFLKKDRVAKEWLWRPGFSKAPKGKPGAAATSKPTTGPAS